MHLSGKPIAFLGLLLALNVIMNVLSGVLEFNTLFLLVAASFTVGIAVREYGVRLGVGFYIASILLWIIVAPNKVYGITYSVFGIYILLREVIWEVIDAAKSIVHRRACFIIFRIIIFNIIYIPILLFFPSLLRLGFMVKGSLLPFDMVSPVGVICFIVIGQVIYFIFDYIYVYFQAQVWNKMRGKIFS